MRNNPILLVNVENLPPEGLERQGYVSAEELEFPADERFSLAREVHVDLFISCVKKGILCQGRINAQLSCTCDRCLTSYHSAVALSDICHLFEDFAEDILDLTYAVREDILLAVPQHNLCSTSCRGLCPMCGQNLNEHDCGCSRSSGETPDVWRALDQLDFSE